MYIYTRVQKYCALNFARKRNSISRAPPERNIHRYGQNYGHTCNDILARSFCTSIAGEILGFFEYSINVRKSYITNRECTRGEGSGRASHAGDYFYLRPFVLAGGKRASGPSFSLPSAASRPTLFSFLLLNHRSFPFPSGIYLRF